MGGHRDIAPHRHPDRGTARATQLSLRHFTSSTTGTLVPLLHIVPSKTDAERLIPVTPELVTVLVAVQRRAKGVYAQVPLSIRYDPTRRSTANRSRTCSPAESAPGKKYCLPR